MSEEAKPEPTIVRALVAEVESDALILKNGYVIVVSDTELIIHPPAGQVTKKWRVRYRRSRWSVPRLRLPRLREVTFWGCIVLGNAITQTTALVICAWCAWIGAPVDRHDVGLCLIHLAVCSALFPTRK